MGIEEICKPILVGLGATVIMDIWAVILLRTFKISSPNYCFVGRWLGHMPAGIFKHDNIAAAQHKTAECTIGWIAHYVVGVSYALILVVTTSGHWLARPSLLPALLVGMGTVVIPYFIMQPCFGLGMAAAKTPNPNQARLRSLMSHAVFGFGLYLSALLLNHVYPS